MLDSSAPLLSGRRIGRSWSRLGEPTKQRYDPFIAVIGDEMQLREVAERPVPPQALCIPGLFEVDGRQGPVGRPGPGRGASVAFGAWANRSILDAPVRSVSSRARRCIIEDACRRPPARGSTALPFTNAIAAQIDLGVVHSARAGSGVDRNCPWSVICLITIHASARVHSSGYSGRTTDRR